MSEDSIKVLTHHRLSNGEHWFRHEQYGKKQIEGIKDPEAGDTDIPPTSIPSPFAAIDLVRGAFDRMSKNGLKGTKIDLKLVSDCLDLGELLFDSETLSHHHKSNRKILEIIPWDKKNHLQSLLNSPHEGHKKLGEVLLLYLEQDARTYNFDKLEQFFIVKYDSQFLGGTSPSTLFFTSSNNLSFARIRRPNGDILFDENTYCHLHERDEDFQLFLYALQVGMDDFKSLYREFSLYLDENKKIIYQKNRQLFEKISDLKRDYYTQNYEEITTGASHYKVNLLNQFPLRRRKIVPGGEDRGKNSDFKILSNKYKGEPAPLVLKPKHDGLSSRGKNLIYFTHPYSKDIGNLIPFQNKTPFTERELPGITGEKYPHLLIDDLLEPYLVRLVYPINKNKYFDGNYNLSAMENGFLIPIKEKYFDFFDVTELMTNATDDGKPFFEIEPKGQGSFNVNLRIPTTNGSYVTFNRQYFPSNSSKESVPEISPTSNKGALIERHISLAVYPFIKVPEEEAKPMYRVLSVDCDDLGETRNNRYSFHFYNSKNQVIRISGEEPRVRSEKNKNALSTSEIYVLEDNFDYISVFDGKKGKGLVIPRFPIYQKQNVTFHFAIDFGTTNTHIEYKQNEKGSPFTFEIGEHELQIATLHDRMQDNDKRFEHLLYDYINTEDIIEKPERLLPGRIGEKYEFKFPQRTVLAERRNLNFRQASFALGDFNIPFVYENRKIIDLETLITTNLKWSNYDMNEHQRRRVKAFFECLIFMIRSKVLINGGSLPSTKITWFYPSSMYTGRVDTLENTWIEVARNYLENETAPIKISESIAPFYYYKQKTDVSAADKPVVAIDIGGGTSDVVIFKDDTPKLITSFKFAANTIFGDGYAEYGKADRNGFVKKYENEIRAILESNGLKNLLDVLATIRKEQKSEDIIAFFFSLEKNKSFLEKKPDNTFSTLLAEDSELRFVFLVFYLAIIYHVIKILKLEGYPPPRYITFSGNGSRALNYIAKNDNRLSDLAVEVIKEIYGKVEPNYRLEVVRESIKPKEATSKGGLMMQYEREEMQFNKLDQLRAILLGVVDNFEVDKITNKPKAKALFKPSSQANDEKLTFDDIKQELLDSVVEEVKSFLKLIYKINKKYPFDERLNISSSTLSKGFGKIEYDLKSYLLAGIQRAKNERRSNSKQVEETLFFYPLVEALFVIASDIGNKRN